LGIYFSNSQSSIVTNSLILHFDAANSSSYSGSGDPIYDLSGNNNNGTLINGAAFTNTKGGEIYFDGSNDYIQLDSPFSYNQHTIEFWIYNESGGSNWVWDARDSNNDGYILFYDNSNPQYYVGNDDIKNVYTNTHLNKWKHILATKDGSNIKLYVDGDLEHTVASSYSINTTTNARIGARSFSPVTHYFNGKVAITRFYSRALSAEEISQNYDAERGRFGVTPYDITLSQLDNNGLVLYLDGANSNSYPGTGNTWSDLSGNGNNFTVYGSPSFNDQMEGGTFVFDESNDYAKSTSTSILNQNAYTKIAVFYPKSSTYNIVSGGGEAQHAFWMNSSNRLRAGHNNSWSIVQHTPSGGMLDKWHFGAVSFNNSSGWKLYHNGSLVDSDNSTTVSSGNGLVRIAAYDDGNNLFDGRIPVVLIYNRILSDSEIQKIHNHFAPRYDLSYGTNSVTINEFALSGTKVGDLTAADVDYPGDIFSFSLVSGNGTNDQDNSSFTISGTQLFLNNSNISYNNKQSLNLYVQLSDGYYTLNKAFVVNVNDLNIAPTDIGLTSNTISENSSIGSNIGTLSAVDSDTSVSSLTYTFTSSGDARDDDNGSFTISGTSLLTSTTLDYEAKNSYNIYINVSDGTSNFAKAFTVSVTSIPKIKRTQIALNNSTVSVTFTSLVYGGSSNSTSTLAVSDFSLSISDGIASLSSATPSSITISGTTIGLGIPLIGTPNGNEILTISPASNAIFGSTGSTVSTTQTSNTTKLIPNIERDGLILYVDSRNQSSYPGDGTTLYDISGNNNDFTINGSMNYNTTDGFTFVSGQTSKYFQQTNFPHPANTFTNEIFIKTSQTSNGGIMSYNKTNNDNANLIWISGDNSGNIRTHTNGTIKNINSNISNNEWRHFVQTVDKSSGVEKIYVDGVLIQTFTSNNSSIPTNGCLALGQDYDTTCGGFNTNDAFGGFFPVFRLYNKVLTESEIIQNYITLVNPPVITSTFLASDNSVVSVTFSEAVFNTNSGSGALEVADFNLSISGGTATLSSATPSSIAINGITVSLGFSLSSTPNGSEVLTIAPVSNAVFNVQGITALSTQSSNTVNLNADSDADGVTDPLDQCTNTPNGESVDANGCAESQKDPDNDGISGVSDNCPTTANSDQADSDGDGVGNLCDNCTDISNSNQSDNDGDAIGDVCDTDDDNDGVLDINDAFPTNPLETLDTDGDGISDNQDPDADDDGILDTSDNCPAVANADQLDTDGDGLGDVCDTDDDNDGYSDSNEYGCDSDMLSATSTPPDMDNDFICDLYDDDIDGDNVLNYNDAFPVDSSEWSDTDLDGIGNNTDTDDDNDGFSDADESQCGSDPLSTNSLPIDSDGDYTPDCIDQDDDNDSYLDNEDLFPLDPYEWADTDGDYTGDNADTDDDDDGYSDQDEISCQSDPLDNNDVPLDFDKDLSPDCIDQDDDNDQCPDTEDDFPLNRLLCKDCDNDGIDNLYEFDSDNDGVGDYQDEFPCDPQEWVDLDKDGIGDNKDQDDNNDKFPDDKLIVSTVLTPNQNGLESIWKIINLEKYPFTKVRVYSPDGSLVYESQDYQNDWKGENIRTGDKLPSGPYYYRVNTSDSLNKIEGWLYIFN